MDPEDQIAAAYAPPFASSTGDRLGRLAARVAARIQRVPGLAERVGVLLAPVPQPGMAWLALALNVLVCPGVGTLLLRRTVSGALQLGLFVVGLPLTLIVVGAPMVLAAWIWALVDGILGVTAAARRRRLAD